MGGRGRGGKSSSLTHDQLQALGCLGKDMPQVLTAPPPTYPPLLSKPAEQPPRSNDGYRILWWEDFRNRMQDSPYCLRLKENILSNNSNRGYRDEWTISPTVVNAKLKKVAKFNWHRMPSELQAAYRKRQHAKSTKDVPKKIKSTNIVEHLKMLEDKEKSDAVNDVKVKTNSDSEHEGEEEAEAGVDEEMDDENDYGNSYFDNGESYNDEDDNLDDGPVY